MDNSEISKAVQEQGKSTAAKTNGALSIGREIWITPSTPIYYFEKLTHEIGHTLAEEDKLSFLTDVLSPDEVKNSKLLLDPESTRALFDKLRRDTLITESDKSLQNLVFDLVRLYTKGKFTPEKLAIHSGVKTETIDEIITNCGGAATSLISDKGEEIQTDTKYGRNVELSAITCQTACRQLLQNTFKANGITFIWRQDFDESEDPSHFRAAKIVNRAYQRQGWKLPSTEDLNK